MSFDNPRLRALALYSVLASTAWLLLADSAEECTNAADRGHLELSGSCPAKLLVERAAAACGADATSESGSLTFTGGRGSVQIGSEQLDTATLYFSFETLERTDGALLHDGVCTFEPARHTYTCTARAQASGSTTATSSVTTELTCSGTYAIVP